MAIESNEIIDLKKYLGLKKIFLGWGKTFGHSSWTYMKPTYQMLECALVEQRYPYLKSVQIYNKRFQN